MVGKFVYLTNYHLIYRQLRGTNRAYVVIRVKNKVLLTKNWLGCHRHWRLPGGGVKKGEDHIKAVIREVNEEVGIKLKSDQLRLLTKKTHWSKHGFAYRIYEVKLKTVPRIVMNRCEIVAAEFFDQNKTKNLPLSEVALTSQNLLN